MTGVIFLLFVWAFPLPHTAHAFTLEDPLGFTKKLPGASKMPKCESSEAPHTLTLLQAIDIALCRNPETQIAWANAKEAAAKVGQATSEYFPEIAAGASIERGHIKRHTETQVDHTTPSSTSTLTSYSPELSLSMLLYDFGGREAAIGAAKQAMVGAGWHYNAAMQAIVFQVVQGYAAVFSAQELLETAKQSEAVSEEACKAAQAKLRIGTVTKADTAQAETAYAQNVLIREQAENGLKLAQGYFATLLHFPPTEPLQLASINPELKEVLFQEKIENLIQRALKERPDLAAIRAREKQAKFEFRQAKAKNYPSLSLLGTHNTTFYRQRGEPTREQSEIMLSLSVPLFTGFNHSYQIRAAKNKLEAETANRLKSEDEVALDVWNAFYNYQTAQQSYKTVQILLKSASASQALALGRYKAGKGTLIDVLDAQARSADANRQAVEVRYHLLVTRFDLARALGTISLAAP